MHIVQHRFKRGFALPTVLIASVILLTVLAFSVSATAAVRTTLKNQYYTQLAQVAGEAGVAFAKACLAQNNNIPQWTDAKPLTPATDCSGNNTLTPTVKALLVAGGGSGGSGTGGGGGGGGVISNDAVPISAATYPFPYPIVVGNGGTSPAITTVGNNGVSSTAFGLTAIGGGGGGYSASASVNAAGKLGGSGGGGQNYGGSTASGAGTVGQGFAGGPLGTTAGSGGGGAGGIGFAGVGASIGGAGGPGIASAISGATVYYAGGGGGAGSAVANSGAAGVGGASPGGEIASAATSNTGGGGGGGWSYAGGRGGAGGSGIVIVAYPKSANITATGGNEIYESGAYKIHKFTANGNFVISSVGNASCPTDTRCSVTVNGNVRSSFTVPRPTLDVDGRAVTIANTGYTEITRTSNGSVWRTFYQPTVQSAVVPALCSGVATASLGWSSAVKSSTQDALANAPTSQSITISDTNVNAGPIYFRKDFNVTSADTYALNVDTPSSQDVAEVYVDSTKVATSSGAFASGSTSLTTGCHTIFVKLTNATFAPRATRFNAALQKSDGSSIAVTDTSWRVAAGAANHFSNANYYAAPSQWSGVREAYNPIWSLNPAARGITMQQTTGTGYTYYRDMRTITVTSDTPISMAWACTYDCKLYLDGNYVGPGNSSYVSTYTATLRPGDHKFAVEQRSAGASGYFYFTALRTSDNAVLSQSDTNWISNNTYSATSQNYYSYDSTYLPTPNPLPTGLVSVLTVGGGGGGGSDMGGGGGGGGVLYNAAYTVVGDTQVTVGGGGTGAPAGISQVRGSNGGNSLFGTITAFGGGGGASEYGNNNSYPGSGGSGGGTASYLQVSTANGILGQGFKGAPAGAAYYPGGGGGAGAVGTIGSGTTIGGNGGIGLQNDIMGPNYYWGGGGGGSGYSTIGGNGGNGGGGGGAVGTTTGGSGLNAGQPGGGGALTAQVNRPGGNAGANTGGGGGGGSHYNFNNTGGNGGTGIVVVSYPTGSLKASGGTITTVGNRTVHTFYSSGTFSIIPSVATVDALVVAGGGGGAGAGSGGGAGGYVFNPGLSITQNTYAVVVGTGGPGGIGSVVGTKGNNSIFNGIVAEGGGYGVNHNNAIPGGNGGSGGGGNIMTTGVPFAGGLGSQGNNGGLGIIEASWVSNTGGGGGAGTPGVAASNAPGWAAGGMGLANNITGVGVFYGGGGGGGEINGNYVGGGGTGGGGSGTLNAAGTNGAVNTGGGGGGGSYTGSYANGGNGGSGIVVIRYLTGSMTATGGSITTVGSYTVHKFTSSDYFTITSIAATPTPTASVNTLVVAGGGSGGAGYEGGGGGAGGVISASQTIAQGDYSVVVGAGGVGGSNTYANGGISSFNTVTAIGGGYGAGEPVGVASPAQPGGSGGGGAHPTQSLVGFGVVGQGNNGGLGLGGSCPCVGGGGGGAGGPGLNAASAAGNGGPGIASTISGSSVYYGGGGGGSFRSSFAGVGGIGGGGNGGGANLGGISATPNTGGGGGAGNAAGGTSVSGSGGSGIVIISYPTGSLTATGGTITTVGGNTIHTFTSSGTFSVLSLAPAALGVNAAPNFASWILSGSASYNSGTGELTLPTSTASASSPLIRVSNITGMKMGGEFFPTVASTNFTPRGGYLTGATYYGSDAATLVANSAGYTSNGCAHDLPLNVWTSETLYCDFFGGSNIQYVKYNISGGAYASPGLKIKNPSIIFN